MSPTPTESYDPEYFAPLFLAEERHFWFRSRNRMIAEVVRQVTATLPAGYRVLEIGCGTGNVLQAIEKECPPGSLIGMDLFLEGLRYARRRVNCPLVQADLHWPPFAKPFELIGLFDVLEHISEDEAVLSSLYRLLSTQGFLLLTVPAFPSLWSYFDEASHHARRYRLSELRDKLRRAGFEIRLISYYMTSTFPLVWLNRKAGRAQPAQAMDKQRENELALEELRIVPVVNGILTWILSQEARLVAKRVRFPFGTSIVALAQRRD